MNLEKEIPIDEIEKIFKISPEVKTTLVFLLKNYNKDVVIDYLTKEEFDIKYLDNLKLGGCIYSYDIDEMNDCEVKSKNTWQYFRKLNRLTYEFINPQTKETKKIKALDKPKTRHKIPRFFCRHNYSLQETKNIYDNCVKLIEEICSLKKVRFNHEDHKYNLINLFYQVLAKYKVIYFNDSIEICLTNRTISNTVRFHTLGRFRNFTKNFNNKAYFHGLTMEDDRFQPLKARVFDNEIKTLEEINNSLGEPRHISKIDFNNIDFTEPIKDFTFVYSSIEVSNATEILYIKEKTFGDT